MLLSQQRKDEDEPMRIGQTAGGKELVQARYGRLHGATLDMKTMGLRTLEATAEVISAIAQPVKRRFVITYADVTEYGLAPPKTMKFTNILDTDDMEMEEKIKHGFSMADKINFKPFVLKSNRVIDQEEGEFLDEVMELLEHTGYAWFRARHQDGKCFTTSELNSGRILPGPQESSFRHTSLYQMTRCTTLIVADSLLGSQGSNGYLRVSACQVVLPGATSKIIRRVADWLLLRIAKKATRVVLVAGTNDWLSLVNPSTSQLLQVAHGVVTTICTTKLERNATGYWLLPPLTDTTTDWSLRRYIQYLADSC